MTRLALCLLLLATLAGCQPDCWSSDPAQCQAEREQARVQANREKMTRHFPGSDIRTLTTTLNVYRDSANGVICWSAGGSTLSCLPEWMLRSNIQAGNERQLSPHETQPEPTPAAAPAAWNDERYQL